MKKWTRRVRRLDSKKDDDYEWFISVSANQSNEIPIQTLISSFRILDLKLEVEPEIADSNILDDDHNDHSNGPDQEKDTEIGDDDAKNETHKLPPSTDNKLYDQRTSHVTILCQVNNHIRSFNY